ncbi:hypothetical protein LCGC14_1378390 [marine sediment metagenome]|uniref:RmlD-like substrate binding domain-containing protein n=1 Tax=marine sediment metagenome TaxID=412755 RepID=A0A0F9N556_9ZZZZ
MLGQAVARAVQEAGHEIVFTAHGACAIEDAAQVFDVVGRQKPDVIINCAGKLPGSDPIDMISTNSLGPHVLASTGVRLVHMSTDCVFSGKRKFQPLPWLTPQDRPDPMDIYGRTKLAGEPESALVVRGSFIGKDGGFLHWLMNATGQVDAWTRALWNGLTADGMANVLVYLASKKRTGVLHVASPNEMSKAAMVNYFVDALGLPVKGIRYVDEPRIDRRLEPDPDLKVQPLPQSLEKLVEELCPV